MPPEIATQQPVLTADAVKALVAEVVSKALAEAEAKRKASNHMGDVPAGTEEAPGRSPITGTSLREDKLDKGIGLARWIKAQAVAKLSGITPEQAAKRWGYERLAKQFRDADEAKVKTLLQSDFDSGGSLVHQQYAGELVELLRNATTIRKAGSRQIPMPGGNLTWDRHTGAATAYYGQEDSAITPSEPTTDQFLLSEKKLTALVPISNDLIRNASQGAEEWVRDDLVQVMAIREDLAFIRGSGAAGEPRGIRNRIAAANLVTETIATPGSPTLQEAKADINKLIKLLRTSNAPEIRRVWIFPPRIETALFNLVGPGGEGTNSLEREMTEKKTLRGYPYFMTNQIPVNLGGATDTEIYLLEMSEIVIGDSMNLQVEVFPNAAYNNSGTIVSGVSNDLTVIRALAKHDINMRHTVSGVCITDSTWGQ